MTQRYHSADLHNFTEELFTAAGCDDDKAAVMAERLLAADLMGHTTHGLALAAAYLEEIESREMTATGEPEVVSDRGAAICWDGRRLPGLWLVARGVELCMARARQHGTATLTVRRSHHAGCLAAGLPPATRAGMMVMIASSDPSAASVAPFGGLASVFTPDPIAIGIPTAGDPVLIDISSSITTNGLTNRLRTEGRRFPGPWALTAEGAATDDPNTLFTNPPGTLLPVGGIDHGHKGYGMALMVEALTQGLSGYGRAEAPAGWGASLFIQVFDPQAFGGAQAFTRQTEWIAAACRGNPPAPGHDAVRLPGARAAENERRAQANGVVLHPAIMPSLAPWVKKFGIATPSAIA
ncbi:MAG: Ldh family oxidoreductase [Rhizobiales bacterium]|nr:Ldh family oxidoreductase [Hyphomicrobiales bacterium]MBI3673101.1 Ldh family oxidoreductase [Hyphomicrobiales bacterium]